MPHKSCWERHIYDRIYDGYVGTAEALAKPVANDMFTISLTKSVPISDGLQCLANFVAKSEFSSSARALQGFSLSSFLEERL